MSSILIRGALLALLAGTACAAETSGTVPVNTIAAAAVRTLTTGVRGPEGPSELPDGSVAMVEFTAGDIIRVDQKGAKDVLAQPGIGVAGTVMGKDGALYVAKLNLSNFMRRPEGESAPGGSPPPAGAAPPPAGGGAPASSRDSSPSAIVRIDLATKQSRVLYSTYEGKELGGPNDLVSDQWGDLWFSDPTTSSVFNARIDGTKLQRVISDAKGVNGITLSPDRKTLYVMNGPNLVSYAISARGTLRSVDGKPQATVVAAWPTGTHEPDGLKTEANGNIVAACWEDGILVFSPQGKLLSRTLVQDLSVINVAFGGKDLKTLYLAGHPANVMVGSLAAIAWPRAGLR
ncbi:MAG: SMP-30/gluconolactonase/LRE family protein [Steroidobacteraceae bacterium]